MKPSPLFLSIVWGILLTGCSLTSHPEHSSQQPETPISQVTLPGQQDASTGTHKEHDQTSTGTTKEPQQVTSNPSTTSETPFRPKSYTKLSWTGYEDIRKIALKNFWIFEWNDTYTNDPSRNVELLPLEIAEKDKATYKAYYLPEPNPSLPPADPLDRHGEDKDNLFLDYGLIATKKSSLPGYIPLQYAGTQAVIGLVGYADGYLIVTPFKFPVDKSSFKAIQDKTFHGRENDIYAPLTYGHWGKRPGFWNGAHYYEDYIWHDKDWVYFRDDTISDLGINRVKKAANFKVEVFPDDVS